MFQEFISWILSYEGTCIILAAGIVYMSIRSIITHVKYRTTAGTLHIDNGEDKVICLFTLDIPIDSLAKKKYVMMKIDSKSHLKSWED